VGELGLVAPLPGLVVDPADGEGVEEPRGVGDGVPVPWLPVDAPGEEVPVVWSPAGDGVSVVGDSVVGSAGVSVELVLPVGSDAVVGLVCAPSVPSEVEDEVSGGPSLPDPPGTVEVSPPLAGGAEGVEPVESDDCCPASEVPVGSVCEGSDPTGVEESVPAEEAGSVVVWPSPASLDADDVEVSSLPLLLVVEEASAGSVESVVVSPRLVVIFIPFVVASGR
jgi:hypothetical protein